MDMGLQRSAYHVYEAKLMAEHSPHVGRDDIQLLVANREQSYLLTEREPERSNCPVSLTELKRMVEKYGAHSTSLLENP